jgi:hypothetical protein
MRQNFIIELRSGKKLTSLKEEKIGSGAHWEVWIIFLETSFSVKDYQYFEIICKIPIRGSASAMQNIEAYDRICKAGLPTVRFLLSGYIDRGKGIEEEPVLITENLNNDNFLFVSPNSVREKSLFDIHDILSSLETEDMNKIREILNHKLKIKNYGTRKRQDSHKYEGSTSEVLIAKNRIKGIKNLRGFIELVFEEAIKAAKNNISMYYDAYFFRVKRDADAVNLMYKIADFDSIAILDDGENHFADLVKDNIGAAYEALSSFINAFVSLENIESYQKELNAIFLEVSIDM